MGRKERRRDGTCHFKPFPIAAISPLYSGFKESELPWGIASGGYYYISLHSAWRANLTRLSTCTNTNWLGLMPILCDAVLSGIYCIGSDDVCTPLVGLGKAEWNLPKNDSTPPTSVVHTILLSLTEYVDIKFCIVALLHVLFAATKYLPAPCRKSSQPGRCDVYTFLPCVVIHGWWEHPLNSTPNTGLNRQ
jgi:hypothetical protein